MLHREKQFDEDGILLEEKPLDANEVMRRKKIAMVQDKLEDFIQRAKNSNEGTDFFGYKYDEHSLPLVKLCLAQCKVHKKKNMRILLVTKFQTKLKYILQPMFVQRGGVKESKYPKNYLNRARERMLRV
jgi:hypothetical protein